MKLGEQIKKHRASLGLSQDALAGKVFVSRQSISNWENGKTYPDIGSLLLLSETFSVSLDTLIKGDIDTMKKEITAQEYAHFQKTSAIFTLLFIALLITPVPLILLLKWWGAGIYAVLAGVGIYYAYQVEKHKKQHDVQTYREIVAFTEGKDLNDIEKAREAGKRPYQKLLLAVGSALAAVAIAALMMKLLG